MEKNSNKIIILLLIVIIVILSVLCVLFATNKITLNAKGDNNVNMQNNEKLEDNTKTELLNVFKFVYDYYDWGNGYCGTYNKDDVIDAKKPLTANFYTASSEYTSYDEMINHLKEYMTTDVIYEKKYGTKYMSRNEYIEKDNKLYCPDYGKGGNLYVMENAIITDSKHLANSYNTTIDVKLSAGETTDNSSYNVIFEKVNNKWIISSFKKQNKN